MKQTKDNTSSCADYGGAPTQPRSRTTEAGITSSLHILEAVSMAADEDVDGCAARKCPIVAERFVVDAVLRACIAKSHIDNFKTNWTACSARGYFT